jgi:ABC-type glycerol-3-phosphate transport system substrate-binding protein
LGIKDNSKIGGKVFMKKMRPVSDVVRRCDDAGFLWQLPGLKRGAKSSAAASSSAATSSSAISSSTAPISSVPASSSSTPVSSVPDDQKITITYEVDHGQKTQPYLENYIAEFNAAYPQYKAVPSYYSGSYNELEQDVIKGFSAGNYPDLVQCYPDHVAEYLGYGKGVDLDPFID